ncbi:MAG TPA: putative glycoside hydrolase [Gaiellaceae bacterium]
MVLEPVDPNARFHERRANARRRQKLRRTAFLLALVVSATLGGLAVWMTAHGTGSAVPEAAKHSTTRSTAQNKSRLPKEIRGIHVTMTLASLKGKLAEYASLTNEGLNTIELDIKDENGAVAFSSPGAPLASEIGAAGNYYNSASVAEQLHAEGIYLIGRVAVFEDPVLSARRPDLAIQRSDGSPWLDDAGLGWSNQYSKKVWDYNVSIAKTAAKAGFDEIQFDYVRFPSDPSAASAVWPGKVDEPQSTTIAHFLQYASSQLKPLGVRVSADVFGLAATNELGVGQSPKQMASAVDALSPMVYPSHFGAGQFGLDDPQAVPGTTVGYALSDFNAAIRGTKAELVPWIQDFSMGGRNFTLADIQDEILAVRHSGARGFLIWNASGEYTPGTLQPES